MAVFFLGFVMALDYLPELVVLWAVYQLLFK